MFCVRVFLPPPFPRFPRRRADLSLRWLGPLVDDLVQAACEEEAVWAELWDSKGSEEVASSGRPGRSK